MARRLKDHFPIVYTSADGYVAHECIIDLRDLKEAAGIGVEDVAKRLVDYGFHAPTMSWPVPETLMIEPTEIRVAGRDRPLLRSHDLDPPGDRRIGGGQGRCPGQRPAQRTPHPSRPAGRLDPALLARARLLSADRSSAVDKYWPPVARVDNVYGDRNLVCTCPAPEAYSDAAE
jgi:glycine dehydrogenase